MIYITGDIHGDAMRIARFARNQKLKKSDVIIILGDVGANYYMDTRDEYTKQLLSYCKPTILCIHGNHECRPEHIGSYKTKKWRGGIVWYEEQYPNVLFAKDAEIFTIDEMRFFVIGGAYSVDKDYRISRGWSWWSDEQPSDDIKKQAEAVLHEKQVDVILSHTCPEKYIPTEMFLPFIDQSSVDRSTEIWLDKIEETTDYKLWYCGHYHTNKHIDKIHFLFDKFETISLQRYSETDSFPTGQEK